MARPFLNGIDLRQTQMLNGVLHNVAGFPASPVAGQLAFNTITGGSATWNGAAWVYHDASKLTGAIPMAALTVDPTQRANHSGTQLASTISNLASTVEAFALSAFAAPTANIAMAGFTLTGLAAPTAAGQAAEYGWVMAQLQNAAAGISSKDPVAAIATTNVSTLSGFQTIDGVAFAAGNTNNRVLLTGQTTAAQNGVWVQASGAWTRSVAEGSSTAELDPGAQWLVLGGTINSGTQWRMSTTGVITPGTTAIAIVQTSAGAVYTAGNGLILSGSAFTVVAASGGGISISAGGVSVDATVVRKFNATIGDGSSTTINVAHNLATQDVTVQVYATASPFAQAEPDVQHTDTNHVALIFAAAPASGAYRRGARLMARYIGTSFAADLLAALLSFAASARTNLGLGGAAVLNVGAIAGTVAAGNDIRITGAAQTGAPISGSSLATSGNLAGSVTPGSNNSLIGWNFTNGTGEVDHFNLYTGALPAVSHIWYQALSGGTYQQLATMSTVGFAANSLRTGGPTGPSWTSGTGAPTSTQPNGSLYSRTDGTVGARFYVSTGSSWNAVMSV